MKITVFGAGNVGATTAHYLLEDNLCDELVLIDVAEGLAKGKVLDMLEASGVRGYTKKATGTEDPSAIQNSDLVIVTAGLARKPGMSRLDLLTTNKKIIESICANIKKFAPNAIVIMVTNPLDVMCYVAYKVLGFKKEKVFGMAGVLDTSRFRYFLADALNLNPKDIQAMVLGGHGDSMVPLLSFTTVSGIPLTELLKDKDKLDKIVERTRKGGGEIVALLKSGSAYYAPAASVVEMVKAIVSDEQQVFPCAAYLDGKYGANDVYCGVPVRLGKSGVVEIVDLPLTGDEKTALEKSIAEVKSSIKELGM